MTIEQMLEIDGLRQENEQLHRQVTQLEEKIRELESIVYEIPIRISTGQLGESEQRVLQYLSTADGWVFPGHLAMAGNSGFGTRALTTLLEELCREGYVEKESSQALFEMGRYRIAGKGLVWLKARA